MVKSIKITVGGKDIDLTLDQAKELKRDLDNLLETKTEFLPINTWPNRPFPVYQPDIDPYPVVTKDLYDSGHAPEIDNYKITC